MKPRVNSPTLVLIASLPLRALRDVLCLTAVLCLIVISTFVTQD